MKLVPEWGWVLRRAWSIRLGALAVLLTLIQIAEQFLPVIRTLAPDPYADIITLIINVAAIVARLIPQRNMPHGKHENEGRRH